MIETHTRTDERQSPEHLHGHRPVRSNRDAYRGPVKDSLDICEFSVGKPALGNIVRALLVQQIERLKTGLQLQDLDVPVENVQRDVVKAASALLL